MTSAFSTKLYTPDQPLNEDELAATIDFLHRHLQQYGDAPEDILASARFLSFDDKAGKRKVHVIGIGAAGVPSAGLVTMIIVLRAVGLPLEGIGILVGIDRILDMCRTTVNVWGDAVGAKVIAHSEGE